MQRKSSGGGVIVGVHVRCLPARDWYKVKAVAKKEKINQEATELPMLSYTLPFSHQPPCWKHLIKFITLFLQSLATNIYSYPLPSTAALCNSPSFSESSIKLKNPCKSTCLRNNQKSRQLQDHSKRYARAICILRYNVKLILNETSPICPAKPFFRASYKSDLLLLSNFIGKFHW